jgi:uncharacterized protein
MDRCIETFSGHMFPIVNPKESDVRITDIANALSKLCRFTGHCSRFYSVAEHSWHCANLLMDQPKEVQLAALLHDASEAYLADIASPIKQYLPDYGYLEDRVASVIFKKYDLEYPMHNLVKWADLSMLSTEAYYLLTSKGNTWEMWKEIKRPKLEPDRRPRHLEPEVAKNVFMLKFIELTKKDNGTDEKENSYEGITY